MAESKVTFVVMAGGKGERLWPLVRAQMPKVCLSPDGTRSLIQQTIDRLRPVAPGADWLIVTTSGQEGPIRRALAKGQKARILVEPEGKNTAACIALAAVAVASRNPSGIMVAVPADHWMGDVPVFQQSMKCAIQAAEKSGCLVTIGISPKSAHCGLGYLLTGSRVAGFQNPKVFHIKRFIEKPGLALAEQLVKQGAFWNSGMFIGKAERFIECITEWLPDYASLMVTLAPWFSTMNVGSPAFKKRLRAVYRRLAGISFDHGVMQHLKDALVVHGNFSWEDLGSWDIWAKLGQTLPKTVMVDSKNISVIGQRNHLVAAIGVQDVVVVQTPTVTLLCHPSRAQEVRRVVSQLSSRREMACYL